MRSLLIFTLITLLSGCAILEKKPVSEAIVLEPEALSKQARLLQKDEKWSEALALLAGRTTPESPATPQLQSLAEEIERDWNMHKRNSEDWILFYEAQSLQQKLPYLERLVEIDSENIITKSRLLFWKKLLESKVPPLISCGSMHLYLDPVLAENCAQLAEKIKPTEQSAHLLSKIQKTREQEKSAAQSKKAVRVKRNLTQQKVRLLIQAKKLRDEEDFQESINTLKKLLSLNPDDAQASKLLKEVTFARDQRVEGLIKFGDALYRDEQIDQAVSVWESAGKLDAERPDIASRIDRALKVLERLREIKEVQ
ncbi:MAG: hypothetical protein OQL20_09295 [Sedimenticola sp.]|nr:hypothetical protein [Sedimenticola sp.]